MRGGEDVDEIKVEVTVKVPGMQDGSRERLEVLETAVEHAKRIAAEGLFMIESPGARVQRLAAIIEALSTKKPQTTGIV